MTVVGFFYKYVITCHHCVSFTVALVICKLQRIYVTSGAASVYFDDADNATCKSRVGFRIPCCPVVWWQSGLFSASAVNVRVADEYKRAIQPCNTHLYCIVVTSWHHKLAINTKININNNKHKIIIITLHWASSALQIASV